MSGSEFSSFDSSFLYVRDMSEEAEVGVNNIGVEENTNRINVWIVNEPEMGHMLTKVLKPEDLEFTFAIIMPDMEHPWLVMEQV